jgi:hypothetical protein
VSSWEDFIACFFFYSEHLELVGGTVPSPHQVIPTWGFWSPSQQAVPLQQIEVICAIVVLENLALDGAVVHPGYQVLGCAGDVHRRVLNKLRAKANV